MRKGAAATAQRTDEQTRRALTNALAFCVTQKGYPATTIADIVAVAHVSKRTFYEHFTSKEECLLTLYGQVSGGVIRVIRDSGSAEQPWQERVSDAVEAFLSALDSMPEFTRTLLVEMQGAGERAFRMRQQTLRGFAETIVELVEAGRTANPQLASLSVTQALAVVGGINELLLHALDNGSFADLHHDVVRLIAAVLTYAAGEPPDRVRE